MIYNKWAKPDYQPREPHSEPIWPVDTVRFTSAGKKAAQDLAGAAGAEMTGDGSAPGTSDGLPGQA
jgi:hypothetical protein